MVRGTIQKIKRNLDFVLSEVGDSLPVENVRDARELIAAHGEWAEALDLICTQLYEYDISISRAVYSAVEEAGTLMRIESHNWSYLEALVS